MTSYQYNTNGRDRGASHEINSYLAVLIITIFGSFMTLLIVRIINSNTITIIQGNDSALSTNLP